MQYRLYLRHDLHLQYDFAASAKQAHSGAGPAASAKQAYSAAKNYTRIPLLVPKLMTGSYQRTVESIYCVPVMDKRLLFAPLQRKAAILNQAAVNIVSRQLRAGNRKDPCSDPVLDLALELAADTTPPPTRTGPARPPFLGLILTRGCNMACRYCDFAADSSEPSADPRLICHAIDGWVRWVVNNGGELLDLRFFGGEPFGEPDLIEIAVHRARWMAATENLPLRIEATTNGLLNARILSFVLDHFDAIVLSLDGSARHHDLHRPLRNGKGTFRNVWKTAKALAQSHVKLCVRVCVSDATVQDMPNITRQFLKEIFPDVITFEPMKSNVASDTAGLSPPQPLDFARAFLESRIICRRAGVECVYAPIFEQARMTSCPVGEDTFILAPDRTIRSCYLRRRDWEAKGLDLTIGRVLSNSQLQIDEPAVQRLRVLVASRARCQKCFCRWSCAGGCLVHETPPGHGHGYTTFCRQTRLLQACVLLHEMGMTAFADQLLGDTDAVKRLWAHHDDRLERME